MARKVFDIAALAALTGLLACGDPTGDLRNGAQKITTDFQLTTVDLGKTTLLTASILDDQGNALPGAITATSNNAAAVSVTEVDSFRQGIQDKLKRQYLVTGLQSDSALISFTGGGKTDTVRVTVKAAGAVLILNGAPIGDTVTVAAAIAAPVTLQGADNITFDNNTTVSFNGVNAVVTGVSVDGKTLTFIPVPGSAFPNPAVAVVHTTVGYGPNLGTLTLTSSNGLTVPPVTSIPAVFANAAPNINETVSVTAAGFLFLPGATAVWGTSSLPIDSVSADGSTAYMRASGPTGAAATVSFSGVALDVIPAASLSNVVSTNTMSIGATVSGALSGTDAIATAPLVAMPTSGNVAQINDFGPTAVAAECGAVGNHCRFYKIVVPADGTYDFTINWGSTADFGGYFLDAAGNDLFGDFACDAHGSGATAHPEACTEDLAAGTYYFALADFTAGAQNTTYTVDISAQ